VSEQKLPVLGPEGGSPEPPREIEASSLRLVGTLTIAGALAGLAIVLVFQWAQPRIEAHQAEVLRAAITEVLGGPDHYETVFLEDGKATRTPQSDTAGMDRVWVGYDENGQPVGVAVEGAEAGFQDIITLIFGYDPGTGDVLGMTVLDSKETPGLGDKIIKDSTFIREFEGVASPLQGVKAGNKTGAEDEVVMITGATISSTAVIKIINDRVDAVRKPLDAFWSSPDVAAEADSAPVDGASPDASPQTDAAAGGTP
jgi:electron transport complex protein RnfG